MQNSKINLFLNACLTSEVVCSYIFAVSNKVRKFLFTCISTEQLNTRNKLDADNTMILDQIDIPTYFNIGNC